MGSSSSPDITPGTTSDLPEEEQVTVSPRQSEQETFHPPVVPAEQQDGPTRTPGVNQTSDPEPETTPSVEDLVNTTPQQVTATPTDTTKPTYLDPSRPGFRANPTSPSHPVSTIAETAGPGHPPVEPVPTEPQFTDSEVSRPAPPQFQPRPPQIVVVDEDLDVNGTILDLVVL